MRVTVAGRRGRSPRRSPSGAVPASWVPSSGSKARAGGPRDGLAAALAGAAQPGTGGVQVRPLAAARCAAVRIAVSSSRFSWTGGARPGYPFRDRAHCRPPSGGGPPS